jgi:hypothetical protein
MEPLVAGGSGAAPDYPVPANPSTIGQHRPAHLATLPHMTAGVHSSRYGPVISMAWQHCVSRSSIGKSICTILSDKQVLLNICV